MIRMDITGEQGAGKTWMVETIILPALRKAGIAVRVADGEPEPGTFYPATVQAARPEVEVRIVVTNAPLKQPKKPRGRK